MGAEHEKNLNQTNEKMFVFSREHSLKLLTNEVKTLSGNRDSIKFHYSVVHCIYHSLATCKNIVRLHWLFKQQHLFALHHFLLCFTPKDVNSN